MITPFSHDTLMTLNIILASAHLVLSALLLFLINRGTVLPSYVLPVFLGISIIVCLLILIYSIDCKNMKM